MKKVVKPGILAGVLMLVAGMGLSYLLNFIFPSLAVEYENANLFRPWSDPLMSIYFAYPFVLGLVLAWAWEKTKKLFKGDDNKRGVDFGLSVWLITSVPGMIITYSSFQVSLLIVLTWTLSSLVNAILAGLVFARVVK